MFARSLTMILPFVVCFGISETCASQVRPWPPIVNQPSPEPVAAAVAPRGGRSDPPPISRNDKRLIQPDAADVTRFRDLLSKPGHGIAKLLNSPCSNDQNGAYVVDASKNCTNSLPGNGSHFSFRTGEHSLPEFSDLKIKNGRFIGGSIMTQGLIVALKEAGLSEVDFSCDEMKYLADFHPADSVDGAQKQTALINRGMWNDGHFYSGSTEIKENQIYALRSIAYRLKGEIPDKRRDIIVAFQVVRQDDDGNVTLIWKELQNKESPKLYQDK